MKDKNVAFPLEGNHISVLKGDSFFGRRLFGGTRFYFYRDGLMVPELVIMRIKTVAGRNEVPY